MADSEIKLDDRKKGVQIHPALFAIGCAVLSALSLFLAGPYILRFLCVGAGIGLAARGIALSNEKIHWLVLNVLSLSVASFLLIFEIEFLLSK